MDIRLVIGCAATSVALISVPVVAAGQQEVAVERHHMIPLGQPESWRLPTGPARVTGLGSAAFGIAPDALPAILTAEFGPEAAARLRRDDSLDLAGRVVLTTSIPWLTDAVPARLSYIFADQRLVQINVEWPVVADATPQLCAALVRAAQEITANLYESNWNPLSVRRGRRLAPNAVLVFAGEDPLGRGVEIALFGCEPRAATPATSNAEGALLRVSYAEDIFGRNILGPGDF